MNFIVESILRFYPFEFVLLSWWVWSRYPFTSSLPYYNHKILLNLMSFAFYTVFLPAGYDLHIWKKVYYLHEHNIRSSDRDKKKCGCSRLMFIVSFYLTKKITDPSFCWYWQVGMLLYCACQEASKLNYLCIVPCTFFIWNIMQSMRNYVGNNLAVYIYFMTLFYEHFFSSDKKRVEEKRRQNTVKTAVHHTRIFWCLPNPSVFWMEFNASTWQCLFARWKK